MSTTASSADDAAVPPTIPIRVLIVGTGRAAAFLFKALSSPAYSALFHLSALARPTDDAAKLSRRAALQRDYSVQLVPGDLAQSEAELTAILTAGHYHTVISTTSFLSPTSQQLSLMHCCQLSGVRRFIPSDFGPNWTAFAPDNPIQQTSESKLQVQRALEQSGLDWLSITPGFFYCHLLGSFTGVDLAAHSITAPASFDCRLTATDEDDIGRAVAEALKRDLHCQRVVTAGATFTWGQLADLLDEETGHTFTRVTRTREDIESELAEKGADAALMTKFAKIQVDEKGTWWPVEGTFNDSYGMQMKGLREGVRDQVKKTAAKAAETANSV